MRYLGVPINEQGACWPEAVLEKWPGLARGTAFSHPDASVVNTCARGRVSRVVERLAEVAADMGVTWFAPVMIGDACAAVACVDGVVLVEYADDCLTAMCALLGQLHDQQAAGEAGRPVADTQTDQALSRPPAALAAPRP